MSEKNTGFSYEEFLAAEKTIVKYKILEFKVGNALFNIKVKKNLELENKISIAQKTLTQLESDDFAVGLNIEHSLLLAILETMTDLKFPENPATKDLFLLKLIDQGIVPKILEELGENIFKEINVFLEEFNEALPKIAESLDQNAE